ncbi:hypothetical protein BGZ83_002365, partial [Gryganskiella cystojenkinii]
MQFNPLASKLHHLSESEYQLPFGNDMPMGPHGVSPEALSEKLQHLQQQLLTQQPNSRHHGHHSRSHHDSSASSSSHRHHHLYSHESSSVDCDKKSTQDALHEILTRIERHRHEKEEKERELEAEILRRQNNTRKLNPDLLKDHLHHTLKQNHGNANLRH